jgi:hypothetical protein
MLDASFGVALQAMHELLREAQVKRAYIWLIAHNACPCGWPRWIPGHAWMAYWCGRLDNAWLWPEEDA